MQKKKSILIVSGGSIDVDFAKEYLRERQYDHIVAADSGLAHCKEIGIDQQISLEILIALEI